MDAYLESIKPEKETPKKNTWVKEKTKMLLNHFFMNKSIFVY